MNRKLKRKEGRMNERGCFLGGVALSGYYSLLQPEIIKTVVLAVVGTLVSYSCGKILLALKSLFKKQKDK